MPSLRKLPYVCSSCLRTLKGDRLIPNQQKNVLNNLPRSYSNAARQSRPLRVAVIGSGPAGFYSAYRVLNKVPGAVVDMYEQLPVPYGLVRFGVAPDHPEVKNCQDKFEEVATSSRFNFIGNIDVGHDLPLASLKPHYDAFLFAYGASKDKRLGIPGEDLDGIYSARAFVGWYNGLPQYSKFDPKLGIGEEAVIIGQGNVALDVARILLTDVDALRKTDITEHALETLLKSRIKSVKVVGRRGPMQAAYTIKEVRELMHLPSVSFTPIEPSLLPEDASKLPRAQKRMVEVLKKGSSTDLSSASKNWSLNYFLLPTAFNSSADDPSRIAGVDFNQTSFVASASPLDPKAQVEPTDTTGTLPASIAFRSVGYKSSALPGLKHLGVPFDEHRGTIPNDVYGRVIRPAAAGPERLSASLVPGMYCAGWVKKGPTGVIASTMMDAFSSADALAQDWDSGIVPFLNSETGESSGLGWDGVKGEAEHRSLRRVSWEYWKAIDAVERAKGKVLGKEREKFTSVDEMLKVLDK